MDPTSSEDELETIQNEYQNYKCSSLIDLWSKRLEELSKEINEIPFIPKEYLLDELRVMNVTNPFKNCIRIPHEFNKCMYILHATGDCDTIYGRVYVALPVGTDYNNKQIREKYNLM